MTIIPLPKQDPEPHEADLVTMDVLLEEALMHINELRARLLHMLNVTDPPADILEKAVKVTVLADMFLHQLEKPDGWHDDNTG